MKKLGIIFIISLVVFGFFLLGFNKGVKIQPHTYYEVYLDNELIGLIESKTELEEYINSQADVIRENVKDYITKLDAITSFNTNIDKTQIVTNKKDQAKDLINNKDNYNLSDIDVDNLQNYIDYKLYDYNESDIKIMEDYVSENEIYGYTEDIYTPNGIKIKKNYTYDTNIMTVPDIYKKIIEKKSCTIAGYKFTIKSADDTKDDIEIYTIDTDIFNDAIEELITIFVDEDKYESYKKDNQQEITSTGSVIENIYVNEEIVYKAMNISIGEKIYTNSKDLSNYLLRGSDFKENIVQVSSGDSIESLAFNNQISVQEFLIFNPQYTSRNNLLVPGEDVVISTIDPKIQIVVENYEVIDKDVAFSTVEEYDSSLNQGSMVVKQEGENGLERVSQNVKSINGEITYVDPVDKQILKPSISKIINIGTKYVPNVGSTTSWGWPTNSGYTLSSYYGYRPMIFGSNWHSGLDIAGTGYGSPIYASNNGVIITREWHYSYGWYIVIDHNNGYYTAYAHMSRFSDEFSVGSTVSRGDTIGYVGTSGSASGPHLHYEIRTCPGYNCTINPLSFY
ncbi:MAG: peptidoglycan DD-metalloendopeptidase family protein [bacterium]|nr:peptidoglycan DD-metalloendopeptidase family protein [bacterium]